MSKLYITARTDMSRTDKTARGNKMVQASIGYDESDYSKKIRTIVKRENELISLLVSDKNKDILVCDGTIKEGITNCSLLDIE